MTDDATRAAFLLGIIDELTDNLFVLRDEVEKGGLLRRRAVD